MPSKARAGLTVAQAKEVLAAAVSIMSVKKENTMTVRGWEVRYKLRGNASTSAGDMLITAPAKESLAPIRSLSALRKVLGLTEADQAAAPAEEEKRERKASAKGAQAKQAPAPPAPSREPRPARSAPISYAPPPDPELTSKRAGKQKAAAPPARAPPARAPAPAPGPGRTGPPRPTKRPAPPSSPATPAKEEAPKRPRTTSYGGGAANDGGAESAAAVGSGAVQAEKTTEQPMTASAAHGDDLRMSLLLELSHVHRLDKHGRLAGMPAAADADEATPAKPALVAVAPPSLAAVLQRLRAGGYANVPELSGDLDALLASARARARHEADSRNDVGVGGPVGRRGVVSLGEGEAEVARLTAACREAIMKHASRSATARLRGEALPIETQASRGGATVHAALAPVAPPALPLPLLVAPPLASKPPVGRAWWQSRVDDRAIVMPPTEEGAIPSDIERRARRGASGGPPSIHAASTATSCEDLEVGRWLAWATEHLPLFTPCAAPCACVVDGRKASTLLGWVKTAPSEMPPSQHSPQTFSLQPPSSCVRCVKDSGETGRAVYGVLLGYYCARPVQVLAARLELEATTIGQSASGEAAASAPAAENVPTVSVRWADGEVSCERSARLGLCVANAEQTAESMQPIDEDSVRADAPRGWWAILDRLPTTSETSRDAADAADTDVASGSARAALVRDAASWGFGWQRGGARPLWSDAESALLRRHMHGVGAAHRPLMMSLVSMIFARPLSYVRERWHAEGAPPPPAAATLLAPASAPTNGKMPVGATAAYAPAHAGGVLSACDAPRHHSPGLATLGALHAEVASTVWQLAALLGSATPPELWKLARLEDAPSGGVLPVNVREQLKHIEAGMYALEKKMEDPMRRGATADAPDGQLPKGDAKGDDNGDANGTNANGTDASGGAGGAPALSVAEDAANAADCRRYVFRIDDITHETRGGAPAPHRWRHPISAVNEVDDELFPDIDYLHACVPGEGVCLETPPEFLVGCTCEDNVAAAERGAWCGLDGGCTCLHEQVVQSNGVVYTSAGRLVPAFQFGTPIYECNAACACPGTCSNRVVQRGIAARLQVFKTFQKGWAVRPLERILAGSFICEYVGEVITTDEAERRGIEYDKGGFSTLFDLDSAGDDRCEYTIDATNRCGVARFFNHSCAPNVRQTSVWVDTLSLTLHRIGFFALRDIEPGEELSFNYGYEEGQRTLECHCGAPNCRKWLY